MSSRKVIKPDVIRSVEAALSGVDASPLLKQGSVVSIEDDSRAVIEEFSQTVDKTTEGIMTIVTSLNSYLNEVATAFENKDQELSSHIVVESRYDTTTTQIRAKNKRLRESEAYQSIY